MEAFRSVSNAARSAARASATASNEQVRSVQRSTTAVVRSEREKERASTSASRVAEREAARASRAAKKEADDVAKFVRRAEENTTKFMMQEREKRVREERRAADRIRREHERAARDRASGKTGIEGLSKKEAMSMLSGSSAFGMASLGGIGLAIGGALALKSALTMAATALTQFGQFVFTEIIRPELGAKRAATQLGNASGTPSASVLAAATSLAAMHGGGKDRALAALSSAYEVTRDMGKARGVADISLGVARAYGVDDVGAFATHMARSRAGMRDMSDEQFRSFAQLSAAQAMGGGLSVANQAMLGDEVRRIAEHTLGTKSTNMLSAQGIIGLSAYDTGNAQSSAAGFSSLLGDASKYNEYRVGQFDPRVKDIEGLIPDLLRRYKSEQEMRKSGRYEESSIEFMRTFFGMRASGQDVGARIKGMGTGLSTSQSTIGAQERSVAEEAEEKFAAAVERLKAMLVRLTPAAEDLIDVFVKAEPDLSALIQKGIIPLGVALMDLAAFIVSDIGPSGGILAGTFDLVAGAMRMGMTVFTAVPGTIAAALGAILKLVSKIPGMGGGDIEKSADWLLGVGKDLTVGGAGQFLGGIGKMQRGMANQDNRLGGTGWNPTSNAAVATATSPTMQNTLQGAFGSGKMHAADGNVVTIDAKSIALMAQTMKDHRHTSRFTPQADPARAM